MKRFSVREILCFLGILLIASGGVSETVAIIGAGPSGLVAAKSAMESGLQPTVFEKNRDMGGTGNPKQGSTWKTMKTNLSKFSCMFSDFPHRFSTEDFPLACDMHAYLKSYAAYFGL